MDARGESPLRPMLWRRGSSGADQDSARQAWQPPGNNNAERARLDMFATTRRCSGVGRAGGLVIWCGVEEAVVIGK
jgi:hypothetical protein